MHTQWLRHSQSLGLGHLQPSQQAQCHLSAHSGPSQDSPCPSPTQLLANCTQASISRDWEAVRSVEPLPLYRPCPSCCPADQDMLFLLTVMCLWKSTDCCCFITFCFCQTDVTSKVFLNMHDHIQNLLQNLFSRHTRSDN